MFHAPTQSCWAPPEIQARIEKELSHTFFRIVSRETKTVGEELHVHP